MTLPMNEEEKIKVMNATVKQLRDIIQGRQKFRFETLQTLSSTAIDSSLPESVKKMREEEASKIRAVIQEQNELIELIKVLFPDV